MLDLASKLRKSVFSPIVMVKELWFYNYQDFRLIFEQSDVLHYFYVSANSQRLLARIFIVTTVSMLMMITVLALHSGVSVWRYKNLEASKLLAEQKREEALTALAALSEDDLDDKHGASPDELIKVAQGYKDRLNKMQTLVDFSSRELKLASRALEQGLNASGIGGNVLQKMKVRVSSTQKGIGGNSDELKFDKAADWYLDFEEEAVIFPRGKHDDQVDALAYIGLIVNKMIEGASQKQLEDEEYEEEYEQSGLVEIGRSGYTGY